MKSVSYWIVLNFCIGLISTESQTSSYLKDAQPAPSLNQNTTKLVGNSITQGFLPLEQRTRELQEAAQEFKTFEPALTTPKLFFENVSKQHSGKHDVIKSSYYAVEPTDEVTVKIESFTVPQVLTKSIVGSPEVDGIKHNEDYTDDITRYLDQLFQEPINETKDDGYIDNQTYEDSYFEVTTKVIIDDLEDEIFKEKRYEVGADNSNEYDYKDEELYPEEREHADEDPNAVKNSILEFDNFRSNNFTSQHSPPDKPSNTKKEHPNNKAMEATNILEVLRSRIKDAFKDHAMSTTPDTSAYDDEEGSSRLLYSKNPDKLIDKHDKKRMKEHENSKKSSLTIEHQSKTTKKPKTLKKVYTTRKPKAPPRKPKSTTRKPRSPTKKPKRTTRHPKLRTTTEVYNDDLEEDVDIPEEPIVKGGECDRAVKKEILSQCYWGETAYHLVSEASLTPKNFCCSSKAITDCLETQLRKFACREDDDMKLFTHAYRRGYDYLDCPDILKSTDCANLSGSADSTPTQAMTLSLAILASVLFLIV